MIHILNEMRWTVLIAATVGFAMAPLGTAWWDAMLSQYDKSNPIVTMTGKLVRQDADNVWITVGGEKLRTCTYIRVQAYTRHTSGMLSDAFARRENIPERGETKPLGTYSIGTWRIWPRGDAEAVLMYVLHDCDGRVVITKIAEVTL